MIKFINTIIAILLISYVAAQTPIRIKQVESSDQITLKYDTINNSIMWIDIPFEFKVCFNDNDSCWIAYAKNYIDEEFVREGLGGGWEGIPLKIKLGEKYVNQYPSTSYSQQPATCFYLTKTRHYIKFDSDLQDNLSQYTKQMHKTGVITLNIGTLKEFKTKYPKIVERILRNDSIGFLLYKQPLEYIKRISVPVEF